jgi:hypothetical protein
MSEGLSSEITSKVEADKPKDLSAEHVEADKPKDLSAEQKAYYAAKVRRCKEDGEYLADENKSNSRKMAESLSGIARQIRPSTTEDYSAEIKRTISRKTEDISETTYKVPQAWNNYSVEEVALLMRMIEDGKTRGELEQLHAQIISRRGQLRSQVEPYRELHKSAVRKIFEVMFDAHRYFSSRPAKTDTDAFNRRVVGSLTGQQGEYLSQAQKQEININNLLETAGRYKLIADEIMERRLA